MRTVALKDFESGPLIMDLVRPEPGPDEVLVDIRSSSVNGFDVATLDQLPAEVDAGRLRAPIQRNYAPDDVPQALAGFANGTTGKIVISVAG